MSKIAPTLSACFVLGAFVAGSVSAPTLTSAAEMSSKAEIMAAVSDKTYQGSMLEDSFVEYYAPDGSISGKDYSGKWRVEEGKMCFAYNNNAETCWGIVINGPAMTLYKDGEVDGNGILIDGNPNNF